MSTYNFSNTAKEARQQQNDICTTAQEMDELYKKRETYKINNKYLNTTILMVTVIMAFIIYFISDYNTRTSIGAIYMCIILFCMYSKYVNNSYINFINTGIKNCSDFLKSRGTPHIEPVFDDISIVKSLYNFFTKKGNRYNIVAVIS